MKTIEDLRLMLLEEAKRDVKSSMNSKQGLIGTIIITSLYLCSWCIVYYVIQPINLGNYFGWIIVSFVFLLILCILFLPIGKIPEERVIKAFNEEIIKRSNYYEEKIRNTEERLEELKKEQTLLRELRLKC